MKDTYSIKRFDACDWPLIRRTRLNMLTVDPRAFDVDIREAETADEATWKRWAVGDGSTPRSSWGVFHDDVCVGMIAAHSDLADCHVGALWIRPEDRGAGMAHRLIEAAETWAQEVGCSRVVLGVADWNPVKSSYERRRYTRTGLVTCTRWGHLELEMVKPLRT